MEKHASSKSYFISCEDCDAQGKGFDKTYVNPAVLAIAAWNKRVVVPLSNTSDQQPR